MSGKNTLLRLRTGATALVVLSFFSVTQARADYAIAPGDLLEITVVGMPALRRKVMVNADGTIPYPLIGNVPIAGLSVEGVREQLQTMLAARKLATNPDVTVEIAEYRPIYVTGDVLKPGAYPFRPGLSLRNAVALAGGYDVTQMRGRNLPLEGSTARADFDLAAVEFAKEQVRSIRIKAELAGQTGLDLTGLQNSSVRPDALAEIVRVENQQLQADLQKKAREKDYYDQLRKGITGQIAQLAQESDFWSTSVQQLGADVSRSQSNLQSAVGTIGRVEQARQNLLVSESRLFDAQTRIGQLRKDQSDAAHRQDAAADEVQNKLLQALRDSVVDVTKACYGMDAASDKMRLTGSLQAQRDKSPPQILVYDASDPPKPGVRATEDTILTPGQTVEVTFLHRAMDGSMVEGPAGDQGCIGAAAPGK